MINAALEAFRDLLTPPFRTVALKVLGLTILLLVLMIVGLEWVFGYFVEWPSWIEDSIQVLGGLALVVGSMFLIPAVSSLIVGLYLDDIAAEVEKQHYPEQPPGDELPVGISIWLAIKFFFVVIGVNILVLLLLIVPGVNLIAFFVGNGYLLGREFFEMVAMRYMPIAEARAFRKQNSFYVFLCGLLIAGIASVPLLNLLTPLFATAFMVHVFKQMAMRKRIGLPAA
ncbi:CysZ-like protein [Methyloligella halotolerans]|uniref:CysZ-like protein n=1 Tax=Methyloligella halotolerans TaxID=1177755 RepID=A0A1E2S153_9HYPH|nr:sulfate transporter family protein [Methyloligella halotolerans]ODA68055.1 CysZ-like protein [Methyloligella halotolerans]